MEEFAADAAIEADAARDVMHVGADALAQIGHLVDEGHLHRQERVGRVFGELRGFEVGEQDRRLDQVERPIQPAQHFARPFAFGADDDAVRPHEVADRAAFAQEFGVAGDVEFQVRAGAAHDLGDPPAGADRDGRFRDHDCVAGERAGDLLGGGVDVADVGVAVAAAGRRADGDEHRFHAGDRFREIVAEAQPPSGDIVGHELIETGLVDRNPPLAERRKLRLVGFDHRDLDAEVGEAGA